jgi:hypothetical protein
MCVEGIFFLPLTRLPVMSRRKSVSSSRTTVVLPYRLPNLFSTTESRLHCSNAARAWRTVEAARFVSSHIVGTDGKMLVPSGSAQSQIFIITKRIDALGKSISQQAPTSSFATSKFPLFHHTKFRSEKLLLSRPRLETFVEILPGTYAAPSKRGAIQDDFTTIARRKSASRLKALFQSQLGKRALADLKQALSTSAPQCKVYLC